MTYRTKKDLIYALISPDNVVLDVGFYGQGIRSGNGQWPHAILKGRAKDVYGLDLELDPEYQGNDHYLQGNAETFDFQRTFDVIFAGDLIEHLSNPGLFLHSCKKHLNPGGRLILTTPNTFNLFNMAEKLSKSEPTVNVDHTFYFNNRTLGKLLEKNGFAVINSSYLYTLGYEIRESWKKKFLNLVYAALSNFTEKFMETLVVVAKVV